MRNSILNDLQEEMQDEITTSNENYDIGTVGIFRGIYLYNEVPNTPCICFTCQFDRVLKSFAGQQDRELTVFIYGYATTTEDIHTLAKDTEYFLLNDYSKKNETITGDIEILEAKENETENCFFSIETKIKYKYQINEL